MINLSIIQYLKPHGHKREINYPISDYYKDKIILLKENNCKVTCEQLSTGEAAQYITHPEGDILVEISPCGKEADLALLKMLNEITQDIIDAFIEKINNE